MSKKSINILIILIVLPFLSLFSKERSSVILNTLPVNTYYLYGYQKGNEFLIDSIITKKNNSKFKKSITQGQYVIKEKKGSEKKSLFSFFVPDKKEKFVFSFSNNEAKQLSGTLENSLYLDLQNSLNNASEKFTTNIEFVEHLDSLYNISDLKIHNSFLYILLNGTLNKGSNSFSIWDEPKLINTQFVDTQINKYLKGIEKQNNSSILDTIDNIILNNITLKNLEYKSYLAQELFSYFSNSNIMGKDEIAVRIAQNYFLNNKLILPKTEDFILLQNYVSLNKSSLIGMRAPNLDLLSVNDDTVSLNSLPSIPTIIFFYTDNCGVCKSEIIKLIDFINGYNDGMLNVYAVYTDANKDIWKKYIQENFADEIYNPFINWVNVYDPTMESGFHLLYNVLATPQMYLLDNNKKIIGRNLNTRSLSELMRAKNEYDKQLKQLLT